MPNTTGSPWRPKPGKPAAEAGQDRAALLAIVSRDLRGPLATAAAAVNSLRAPDAAWTASETAGLLASAAESLGQLTRLTGNLLDLSRLQAATLPIRPRPADVADTIVHAVASVGPQAA
jgi:two-component system, OmpR family, sensor histidine kinase KdpD